MAKTESLKNNNEIRITIDSRVYPLEAVYGAAYVFLDKAYVRLDGDPKKEIIIFLKNKKGFEGGDKEKLKGEFLNELLNQGLRFQISKQNQKIREYIVGTAIMGALGEESKEGEEDDWQKDAMGIAVPWEEKYKKK